MNSLGANAKPFLAVIFLQFGFSGMSLITKFALDQGMNQHVLVVYRHAIATLVIAPFAFVFDRKVRPKMSLSIFIKILILGLLPTIDQNLYYTGMKYTTATFTSAMSNVLPAFAFLLAWIFKLEKVNIRKVHSQAKILGTIVTVGGAMLMTMINGPMLQLPWAESNNLLLLSTASPPEQDPIKGALMIAAGCFCWAAFIILQAITLKSYPAELSLTALICVAGTVEGSIVALAMEAGNAAAWSVHLDVKFLAAVYGGVVCSGIAYYVQGVVMKTRGPVFVTAFNPLSMVIVAILSSFILSEVLYLGRVLGAVVIVAGLYLVLWGKSKDDNFKTSASNDEKMIVAGNHYMTMVSDRDFVVLGLSHSKVTPTVEPV
ncbi:Usually multiple acids move in and out Transporters 14 [Hibiscus trionum]|uniref:WAT1-related protein n=1 Tax=Hibiscus trionum TaxID=183268 RepID=A0A9W7M0T0_HIBTR|nr:Usually multiple acids move in and out Transporters 14 [Hibiscus trionum]